jgi:hypothetical protein
MADAAIFMGWTRPARGREQQAAKVFQEAVAYWSGLQQSGAIESWEAFFLEPHGGDLGGFFLVRGEKGAIDKVRTSEELAQLTGRAQICVDGMGVVSAVTGPRIEEVMGRFLENAAELS